MMNLGILGVWTMENIVSAIIGAGAVIAVAIIGAIGSIWNRAGKSNQQLTQHDTEIKNETKEIKGAIKNSSDAIATANATLMFLERNKREEIGAQKYLDEERKTIVNNTRALATEFEKLVAENKRQAEIITSINIEIKALRKENQDIQEENAHLKGKLIGQKPHQYEHGDYEQDMF